MTPPPLTPAPSLPEKLAKRVRASPETETPAPSLLDLPAEAAVKKDAAGESAPAPLAPTHQPQKVTEPETGQLEKVEDDETPQTETVEDVEVPESDKVEERETAQPRDVEEPNAPQLKKVENAEAPQTLIVGRKLYFKHLLSSFGQTLSCPRPATSLIGRL